MKQLREESARLEAEREAPIFRRRIGSVSGSLGACPLCGRAMVAGPSLNEHHLVPRMFGGRETSTIHRICHSKIHSVFSEAELAREYHTFEKLRTHDEILRFIKWVRKQSPETNAKHARRRR